jgi:FkbM family methyltransferase
VPVRSRLRSLAKEWLLGRGVLISRPPGQFDVMHLKLSAARARGLEIGSAIDGGAADGSWARLFHRVYPEASILCVEPRESCATSLERVTAELGNARHAAVCLGSRRGTVAVNVSGDQSSILENSLGERFGTRATYEMTRLDDLVADTGFPQPDLIKLDLQGAELEALAGAGACLEHAQVLVLEVSFLPFQRGAPLLHDTLSFCEARGFRAYDIPGLWHRPLDGALAQADVMFVREGHPLISDPRWSADFA